MKLQSVRIITADIDSMVAFYELVTGVHAAWATPAFAEVTTDGGTIAIGDVSTVAGFGPHSAHPAHNSSAIIEFLVADVDTEWTRLQEHVHDAAEPTTMPWGNRSLLLRDPDGGLVNLFTPVTPAAREKFGA